MAEEKKQSAEKSQKKGIIWVIGFIIAVVAGVIFGFSRNDDDGGEIGAELEPLKVHYIDVGQGDSIFIQSGEDTMLIDCGEIGKDDEVKAYLDNLGITQIDYVIGTHPHSDHMGCMDKIVEYYDIGEIILPHLDDSDVPTTKYFERFLTAVENKGMTITEAEADRVIRINTAECRFIAPCSDDYSNANNYSVGIIMTYGENSFIFTGDAEKLAEKEMIESGKLQDIDVYKVGHHGSDTSSSEEFLEVIKPDIAVISCGEGNSYGHPCDITLEKLSKYTDKVYRTDISGSVVITSDGKELTVTEENGG
ncbi:MAG: MBL fold metallo-hydrolase [Ruminococcus flavefaciens]|nr:MBL fold metallo-hydrolase [Ruminococcus flavefaciens]MCM1229003.1 MBL fold metallo-hydrolase [Ruminococcus flavefaciens]